MMDTQILLSHWFREVRTISDGVKPRASDTRSVASKRVWIKRASRLPFRPRPRCSAAATRSRTSSTPQWGTGRCDWFDAAPFELRVNLGGTAGWWIARERSLFIYLLYHKTNTYDKEVLV